MCFGYACVQFGVYYIGVFMCVGILVRNHAVMCTVCPGFMSVTLSAFLALCVHSHCVHPSLGHFGCVATAL